METSLAVAVGLGLTHTVLGPDHYLPFLVIGRARRWGLSGTLALTVCCGLGHVASSVLLGLVGALLGASLGELQALETYRGGLAGWALLIFGLGYGAYGLYRARFHGHHGHVHLHRDGTIHSHDHDHSPDTPAIPHDHPHGDSEADSGAQPWRDLTPWVLFVIFVLGPCEPLIPLFFADAVTGDWGRAAAIAGGYGLATIATMITIVVLAWRGLFHRGLGRLERFEHALAGGILGLAGFSMVFLGL